MATPQKPQRHQCYALLTLGVMLAPLLAIHSAFAVPVQGRLQIPNALHQQGERETSRRPQHHWRLPNGFVRGRTIRFQPERHFAVVLIGDGGGESDCRYRIQGGNFLPTTLVVQAGSEVRIENTDPFPHELFADTIDGFSALSTAPGNARSFSAPNEAGHHEIRDRLYGHVIANLNIVENLVACAEVRPDGSFQFDSVPAGNYELKVAYGGTFVASRKIEVVTGQDLQISNPIALELERR